MEFHSRKAIYEQIGDFICGKIVSGDWKEEERMPSVRDLAVSLQVNPNTVMRTCMELETGEILSNKRGVGLFVARGGRKKALMLMKNEFIRNDLPVIAETMKTLEMDSKELVSLIEDQMKRRK
jgi:DNA-binding transcriptional regulator YhcF (GntR family)